MKNGIWISAVTVKVTAIVMATVGLLSQSASADRINHRQARQRGRIAEGVQSGELTRPEVAKLRAEERQVRRMEKRAKADGTVTPNEAAKIEKAQDRVSKDIYEEKHDDQKRGE